MRPRLTKSEQVVAQAVMDLFAQDAAWPKFGAVERAVVRKIEGDLQEIFINLHQKFEKRRGLTLGHYGREDEVRLPARLIMSLRGADQAFAPLIEALPIIEEIYLNAPEKPEVTHTDFLARGWAAEKVRRLGLLLRSHGHFTGSGGWSPELGTWHREIRPSIRRYAKATTAKEFLAVEVEEAREFHRRRFHKSPRAGEETRKKLIWKVIVPLAVGVVATLAAALILRYV